jgi:hypothetical protein
MKTEVLQLYGKDEEAHPTKEDTGKGEEEGSDSDSEAIICRISIIEMPDAKYLILKARAILSAEEARNHG